MRLRHPDSRPSHYADAGLTLLRSSPSDGEEIWCRCDAGPHGFLSIAAHAHADALAVEVRYDGTDVLADPGTYCYHGEPGWRSYFRSTLAHNTIEVDGQDQSTSGGPFLWTRHARSRLLELETDADGEVTAWSAEHDGYRRSHPTAAPPPLGAAGKPAPAYGDRRRPRDDGRTCVPAGIPPGPRHRCPDGRSTSVDLTLAGGQVHEKRHALLARSVSPGRFRRAAPTRSSVGIPPRFGEKQPTWAVVGEGVCSGAGWTGIGHCFSSMPETEVSPKPLQGRA